MPMSSIPPQCAIAKIDVPTFTHLVQQYMHVAPPKTSSASAAAPDLDQQRYESLPRALTERRPSPFLTKDEVATLVDWKLSHGKFRPTLKALVQQNAAQIVHDTTEEGFAVFSPSVDAVKASIKTLTKLRGIGPATASLLLSVCNPSTAPFFSDELFRWCFFEEGRGKGWDREIKYNVTEYIQLFERVHELRQRFSEDFNVVIAAVDIEKAAYVLGKQGEAVEAVKPDKKRKPSGNEEVIERRDHPAGDGPIAKAAKTRTTARSSTRLSAKGT